MTIESAQNKTMDRLSSSYQPRETEKEEEALGRENFLTMLVAQLENQDPLNPMEGSDFSAQLAQFSSLEQLMNLNETMENMATAFTNSSEADVTNLVGKEVTGEVDAIEVADGQSFGGAYTITEPGDVMVEIYDAEGNEVRSLYPGQKTSGSYNLNWDGRNNSGDMVEDGSYKYKVLVNSGSGFAEMPTTVTGTVDSVVYNEGKAYLRVNDTLVNPESLVQISAGAQTEEAPASITDYLGKEITSSRSIASVKGGNVSGKACSFELENQEDVIVSLFNQTGDEVRSIPLLADETTAGTNTVEWDGKDNAGSLVEEGLYLYSVSTAAGEIATAASGEVSGIEYINGEKYLVLKESGMLTDLSSVTGVN
ncbi:MAG: FlgD immunoglobulin-like domain containing protein [Desulfobacteraceae bacterium]